MKPRIFSAIFLFSIFSYQQVHAPDSSDQDLSEQTKDEIAFKKYDPYEFFSQLEYELDLYIDGDTFWTSYYGSLNITLHPKQKTNKLFLDRKFGYITIDKDSIQAWKYTQEKPEELIVVPVHYGRNVEERDGYKIKLEEWMYTHFIYKIKLEFSGKFKLENNGLIIIDSRYKYKDPAQKDLVYSRINETHAHYIFPCFNRIEMKAKFKIRIGHLKNVPTSFTNAKFISQKEIENPKQWVEDLVDEDMKRLRSKFVEAKDVETKKNLPNLWVLDDFVQTDFMSTFSVALVVLGYKSVKPEFRAVGPPNTNLANVEIKVWAEEDASHHAKVIRSIAALCLGYYADILDTTYDLGKLDLIILPHYNFKIFEENEITVEDYYGVIYLGDNTVKNVLTESTNYRPDRYLLVANICRAVGKQWIGHQVSPFIWYETWFYDGLHTYLERHCVMKVFKDWQVEITLNHIDSFITFLRNEERGHDYNPIVEIRMVSETWTKVLNPETKSKIHFIIQMVSFIMELEEKLFQKSLTNYIKEFKADNPSLRQVWESWTKTAEVKGLEILPENTDIGYVILSWMSQREHPLISAVRSKPHKMITLTQKPFSFPNQKTFGRCWSIPFYIITKSKKEKRRLWLDCRKTSLQIPLTDKEVNEWIVISFELKVPVRVDYDLKSWSQIRDLFNNVKEIARIDSLTRIQVIHDMFTLAEASQIDFDLVFDTIQYMSYETDYKCWHIIHQELIRARSRWTGTKLLDPFQKFVRNIIKPIFNHEIFKISEFLSGPRSRHKKEKIILLIACTFELSNCEEYSKTLLTNLVKHDNYETTNGMSRSLRESFFCTAMKTAEEKEWDYLLEVYKGDLNDRSILRALGCAKNPKLLKKLLDWSLDGKNTMRSPPLSLKIFEILSSSYEGYQLIYPFFRIRRMGATNTDTKSLIEFISKFQTNLTIDDFLIKALENVKKQEDLDTFSKFSSSLKNRKPDKEHLEKEIVSISKRHISWFDEKAEDLFKYLTDSIKVEDSHNPYVKS